MDKSLPLPLLFRDEDHDQVAERMAAVAIRDGIDPVLATAMGAAEYQDLREQIRRSKLS